ncbi:MAG TPA: DUF454 domain-containing protein [Epulopiscium sp.]|nr:DUF454 domain-containing protein [Candidatus Epulonipiscium sp.]
MNAKNTLLIIIGSIAVGLGVIGIFLPLLPTTPFLLVGAYCYFEGSPKLYASLLNNRYLGEYIKNFREYKSIPLKTKIFAIVMLWLTIGYCILYIIPLLLVKILLFIIASAVTVHILSYKTLKK